MSDNYLNNEFIEQSLIELGVYLFIWHDSIKNFHGCILYKEKIDIKH